MSIPKETKTKPQADVQNSEPAQEKKKYPFILAALDGWGINREYNGNAVTEANTPVFDELWKSYPHTQVCAHGQCVGLPLNQDGNSESGHLNLGAGRIVDQDTTIISRAINSGVFFKNPALKATVDHVKEHKSNVHLMGLLSGWQSAHSDPDHLLALLTFYREQGIKNVYLHFFTDGRDSFKYGALKFLKKIEKEMQNKEKIASIIGRYYAMDRKKKWERTERVYNAILTGKSDNYARSAKEAIQQAYDRGETDEFILPTVIVDHGKCNAKGVCVGGKPVATIKNNDAIVYFNLRSDRARQLSKAFVQEEFNKMNPGAFKRSKKIKNMVFVAMTDFGPDLDHILSAFPSKDVKMTLPMALHDLKQLYIAENEKYAHVTYFFNGGYADPVGGEDRMMVASPDVASYDLKPAMSAYQITDYILKDLKNKTHDFIMVNYANPDMVGHTGNLAAGIKACEVVDKCLGRLYKQIQKRGGVMIVTSDHGNIEEMVNQETGEVDTQHSNYPVPFIIVDTREEELKSFTIQKVVHDDRKRYKLRKDGVLGSVAPTILDLMQRSKPKEMTEESLIV